MTLPSLPLRLEAQLLVVLVELHGHHRVSVWALVPMLLELVDVAAGDVHALLQEAWAAGCLELELVHPAELTPEQRALCGSPREDGLVVAFARTGAPDSSELRDQDLGEDPDVTEAESRRYANLFEQRGAA